MVVIGVAIIDHFKGGGDRRHMVAHIIDIPRAVARRQVMANAHRQFELQAQAGVIATRERRRAGLDFIGEKAAGAGRFHFAKLLDGFGGDGDFIPRYRAAVRCPSGRQARLHLVGGG